ncbi:MAG: hypothetical protein JXR73_15705 [Candidatus Omnitrophica bacterium]|nr:hypothetical protein [Candidatus Omnitrophota bacterium]
MRVWLSICLGILLVFTMFGIGALAAPFTPGNLVLTDATNDRVIEVNISGDEPEIVQIITWPLGDTSRRRPLGMAFDPNGTLYVGITGVPTSATEQVQFPTGRAEVLRIKADGTQSFHALPGDEIDKITLVSSFNPDEVFVMRNTPLPYPCYMFRVRFSGDEISDITKFTMSSEDENGQVSSHGEALIMPDGRILIPRHNVSVINVYGPDGGDPIDAIPTERGYVSLAYQEGTDYFLALVNGQKSVDVITLDGEAFDLLDFGSLDGIVESWNVNFLGDGSDKFMLAEKTESDPQSQNAVFIYDASDLAGWPIRYLLPLDEPSSLFDFHFVPEPPAPVDDWPLH